MVWVLWQTVWQFLKKLNIVIIWPNNCNSKYIHSANENLHAQKNLCMNVHSSFIPDSQKVETAQHSSTLCTIKQNMIYSYNGILYCSSNKYNIVLFKQQKGVKYWYTSQHGWTLKICWVKEARHKGPYSVWFHSKKWNATRKPIATAVRLVVPHRVRGSRLGEMKNDCYWVRSFEGDENIWKLIWRTSRLQNCKCNKNNCITYFKWLILWIAP